ncbi:MAG: IS21 family transposase [Proteobacteria bacterium]|nr:IS21 family transposase [Pseudomonadota bacterium]
MIDERTIFEIHRLKDIGYSYRNIADILGISRESTAKYHKAPDLGAARRKPPASKLDGFHDSIDQMLEEYADVSAVVVFQRLKAKGFTGRITIVRDCLGKKRKKHRTKQAFIRFESPPGMRMQVDWGHFGSIDYDGDKRKLYALAVVESYSRRLYVEFTHSQKQETLHQCLFNAFCFFGGTSKELVVDNMPTAVVERDGKVVRFNDAFLKFLRPFKISPWACNVRSPFEKGKVERTIQYIRNNFIPLRKFEDLPDVQEQVRKWLDETANRRIHQTTGEQPDERASRLNPRPIPFPESTTYMETLPVKAYKDFAVRFDGNAYTVPPWCIDKELTLKADQKEIRLFHKTRKITVHQRCWRKRQRIENPGHVEEANKQKRKVAESAETAVFASLGEEFREFLDGLNRSNQPIEKSIRRLLSLKDQYGTGSLSRAIPKALKHAAFGADYIENILHQEMTPDTDHPPVRTKDDAVNQIRLDEPSLAEYDAIILKGAKK